MAWLASGLHASLFADVLSVQLAGFQRSAVVTTVVLSLYLVLFYNVETKHGSQDNHKWLWQLGFTY